MEFKIGARKNEENTQISLGGLAVCLHSRERREESIYNIPGYDQITKIPLHHKKDMHEGQMLEQGI